MTRVLGLILAAGVIAGASAASLAAQGSPSVLRADDCRPWQECRRLALEAVERGDYERFHDVAWRAVQTGPPRNPELMYLLARAQSLSGRPRDALVMIRRLAEMGIATDALTSGEFRRTRALPDWADIESLLARLEASAAVRLEPESRAEGTPAIPPVDPAAPGSPPAVGEAASVPAEASPAPAPTVEAVEEVLRFAAGRFVPGGLAYDAVSRRFLIGNAYARKIVVVGEGARHTVDLVRAPSAGFADVMALEIDRRRGDLWVVSAGARSSGAGEGHDERSALHKIQLISGRPLAIFHPAPEPPPARFSDVAVMRDGTVIVLDGAGPRLVRLRPGARELEPLMALEIGAPMSIAPADDDRLIYISHPQGVLRGDLSTRSVAPLAAADGIGLGGLERCRWHQNSLVGVQALADGSRRIVRIRLDARGRTAVAAEVIDASLSAEAGPVFMAISGDDLYYLAGTAGGGDRHGDGAAGAGLALETLVRRARLRPSR